MEKIIDREVAWRVFAHEFTRSNLYLSEGDERAPNYIITPTGVKCNRLFIVGVVTEVENIGHDNNLWKARIADPTGVFTVYAGQYQPDAAIFLSDLEVPAFVALVGKARKYEPEDGNVYLSIRPEEINLADGKLRDRWVLDTAERTIERIKTVEEAYASGLSGNELAELLKTKGTNPVFADGLVRALAHYNNIDQIIPELKTAVINAINVVAADVPGKDVTGVNKPQMKADESKSQEKPEDKTQINSYETGFEEDIPDKPGLWQEGEEVEETIPGQKFIPGTNFMEEAGEEVPRETEEVSDEIDEVVPEPEITLENNAVETPGKEILPEPKEQIAAILDKLDSGKGVPHSMIVETALAAGMNAVFVESGIKALMAEGRCYEPKIGTLRKV